MLWIRGARLELSAKVGHVRVDGPQRDRFRGSPDFAQELATRRGGAISPRERQQQVELHRRERDDLAVASDDTRRDVDLHRPERLASRAGGAACRTRPGEARRRLEAANAVGPTGCSEDPLEKKCRGVASLIPRELGGRDLADVLEAGAHHAVSIRGGYHQEEDRWRGRRSVLTSPGSGGRPVATGLRALSVAQLGALLEE